MRAIVQDRYGSPDVLDFREIEKPVVGSGAVLVRVHATSANTTDWVHMTGTPYVVRAALGMRRPKQRIPGHDLAGLVEATGTAVTQFQPGDEVFGEIEGGAFAEYVCVPEVALAPKPANVTFEQAAAVPLAANTALQGLRDHGKVQPGQSVLINGASGAVGTFAVQIAKLLGAEVTGVCSSNNVETARSIGANHVVDYTREDFTRSGRRYDVILDLVGNHSLSACRRALESDGIYVSSVGQVRRRWLGPAMRLLRMSLMSGFVSQKMVTFVETPNKADLNFLKEALETGELTPVVDRTYPMSEAREALGYLGEGHARGKIVITV